MTGKERYARHAEQVRRAGNWFPFARVYSWALDRPLAWFLLDLINFGLMRAGPTGRFPCSVQDLEWSQGWDRSTQSKLIKRLENKELIKISRQGRPPVRMIEVNLPAVEALIVPFLKVGKTTAIAVDTIKEDSSLHSESSKEPRVPSDPGTLRRKSVPFFHKEVPSPKWSKEDLACAIKLKKAIHHLDKRPAKWNRAKWADRFRILRAQEADMEEVLDFYCRAAEAGEIKSRNLPTILSADRFAKSDMIDWIRGKMEKAREAKEGKGSSALKKVEVSKMAKIIAEAVPDNWPKDARRLVPHAVQATIDAYVKFYRKVMAYGGRFAKAKNRTPLEGFAFHLFDGGLPTADGFVEEWWHKVNSKVVGWDGWSGDLSYFVFRPDHPMAAEWGRAQASSYADNPDLWNKLVEEL